MADEFHPVSAQMFSDQVLQCVKSSNLHFAVQVTPFSVYITLRKEFVSDKIPNYVKLLQCQNQVNWSSLSWFLLFCLLWFSLVNFGLDIFLAKKIGSEFFSDQK